MRIAFDVGPLRDEPTGVGVFVAAMAKALAAQVPADELAFIGVRDGVSGLPSEVPASRMGRGGYIPWLQTRATSAVEACGADIAHFSDGIVPVRRRSRTVVSIHDMSAARAWRTHPARRWLRVPLVLVSPRLADLVIVPSRATAEEVMALTGTRASKIEVMPYAPQDQIGPAHRVEVARVLANFRLDMGGYILAVGTIEPRKNHKRLVAAFEALVLAGSIPSEMPLVIAGHEGWRAGPIVERIERSPIHERIRRLGYVSREDLRALFSAAAVVTYPSLYEGFGLPVVEAMACGAATVTSNLSSMPEVAGDAGFLVDPYSISDIGRGLLEALDAIEHDRAGIAARATRQAAMFTWDRAAKTAIDLYGSRFPS